MQTGVIVHRKADTMIPNEYLEKVLAENPTAFGAVTLSVNEDGSKFLEINSGTEQLSLEEIQTAMKTFMKQDITFYFCNSETAVNDADVSPYILVCKTEGEEEIPELVAFVEGNFPSFDKAGSSHPREYHLAEDYLQPKLQAMYDMADGNLDKVTEALKKEYFKKELLLQSVSRGFITLVAANGAAMTFAQDSEPLKEFPWGWTSNTYGYKSEAEKKAEELPKKKGLFGGKSTVREKAGTAVVDKPTITAAKTDTTATAPIPEGYTIKQWSPDKHASRRDRENQYKMRIGYLPEGHRNNIAINVVVNPEGRMMAWGQVKALGLEGIELMSRLSKMNPPKAGEGTEPVAVKSSETLPAESKPVSAEILPIMGPKTREYINDIRRKDGYKKIIEENAKVITDPKQFESYEVRFADFALQMGIKEKGPERLAEFSQWSYEMYYDLCKSDAQGGAVMLKAFVDEYLKINLPKVAAEEKVEAPKKTGGLFNKKSAAA